MNTVIGRKMIFTLAVCLLGSGFVGSGLFAQVESIASARAKGPNAVVTISGVITNGDELGVIRYIQDETGGLAIYSPDEMGSTGLGDSVTLTGTLVDYNNLLEMQPVTSIDVHKQNAVLPEPVVVTPASLGEAQESMLIKIENAVFDLAGGTFASQTNYDFHVDNETGEIRISDPTSPFVGKVIPSGATNVIGILSHFYDTYQILVRLEDDLKPTSSINFIQAPVISNLSTSGFDLSWETEIDGTTEMLYGHTPALELGHVKENGTGTSHQLNFSDNDPSTLFYIQPFSVSGEDTAKVKTQVIITSSASSGNMLAYFNMPVDNSVAQGTEAIYVDKALDDTLISYINRAEESIDFTCYNFNNNGISNIAGALNSAHKRGVTVRVVYDINQANLGTDELDSEIGKQASVESAYPVYGIMHNKFVVFDAKSSDPEKAIVWTGATNFSYGQLYTDPNNVIIVHDQSLAITYQLEFNEMFGSEGAQPSTSDARFGPDKTDNTPHEFIIGGKEVQCYFSPSDNTHMRILETLETADTDIEVGTMLITKSDIAYKLRDKHEDGVDVRVLVKDEASCTETVINTLKESLQDRFRISGEAGIYHHKTVIVDRTNAASDPILLTGSHNWSSSADLRNDENTLIIHDQDMAQQYYQEWIVRYRAGQLLVDAPVCEKDFVQMTSGASIRWNVLYNDELPGPVIVEINRQPANGTAVVETDQTITYTPNTDFNQNLDTVHYKVTMEANSNVADSTIMVIYVNLPVGMDNASIEAPVVYPNPSSGTVYIRFGTEQPALDIRVYDLAGRLQYKERSLHSSDSYTLELDHLARGYYLLEFIGEDDLGIVQPLILE